MEPPTNVMEEKVEKSIDKFQDDQLYNREKLSTKMTSSLYDFLFGWKYLSIEYYTMAMFLSKVDEKEVGYLPFASMNVFALFLAAARTLQAVLRRYCKWVRLVYGSGIGYYRDYNNPRKVKRMVNSYISSLLERIHRQRGAVSRRKTQEKLREADLRFDDWRQTHDAVASDEVAVPFDAIINVPYAHGCFFGAAPFMLREHYWTRILRHLMPDVYIDLSRGIHKSPLKSLIHWAENNPVVAAYGNSHELLHNNKLVNLEWDVFLDPAIVQTLQRILKQQEVLLNKKLRETLSKEERLDLKYLEQELNACAANLVDSMMVAHGTLTQIIQEQLPFGKAYNYSCVNRTRQTFGGGLPARQWMATYAEALRLGMMNKEEGLASLELAENTTCSSSIPLSKSVSMLQSTTKRKQPIRLVLDLKSRHVSTRIWSLVVNQLQMSGIAVEGVSSFAIHEIRDISQYCTTKEIVLFHSAGELQHACHKGTIRKGDYVFFNGGSLLTNKCNSTWDPQKIMGTYSLLPYASNAPNSGSTIRDYKERFDLKIGLYVQEFGIDESALALLVQTVNEKADVFELGFGWGGINGTTVQGILPGRWTATDGFHTQRYAGKAWDSTKMALDCKI